MPAYVYLLMSTMAWGLNFHLAIIMLRSSEVMEAGLWRYLFGVGVLAVVSYRHWPRWPQVKGQLGPLLLIGFVGLFIFNFLLFTGMKYTTAVNASLIAGLNPAKTLLFSAMILKTPLTTRKGIGIAIAFVGVIVLVLKGNLIGLGELEISKGDLWMLAASAVFALHHVWVKKYGGKIHNTTFTFLTNFICMMGFVLFLPFSGMGNFTAYPTPYWLSALGMGALGTALAYVAWNKGIAQVGAPQAGVFMNFVPIWGALFGVVFGESLHLYHLASGILVIAGMLIMQDVNWKRFLPGKA